METNQNQEQKPINPRRKVPADRYRPRQKMPPGGKVEDLIRVNGENYAPSNPYRANKWIKDPRQDVMWEQFVKDWMAGQANATRAALQAGYSKTTSANISNFHWFREKFAKLKRKDMLSKAERNLDRVLDLDYTKLNELGQETIDIDKLKLVVDVSKIVATTLGKDEGYSSKTTVDQKVSGQVNIKAVNYADQAIEQPKPAEVIETTGEELLHVGDNPSI